MKRSKSFKHSLNDLDTSPSPCSFKRQRMEPTPDYSSRYSHASASEDTEAAIAARVQAITLGTTLGFGLGLPADSAGTSRTLSFRTGAAIATSRSAAGSALDSGTMPVSVLGTMAVAMIGRELDVARNHDHDHDHNHDRNHARPNHARPRDLAAMAGALPLGLRALSLSQKQKSDDNDNDNDATEDTGVDTNTDSDTDVDTDTDTDTDTDADFSAYAEDDREDESDESVASAPNTPPALVDLDLDLNRRHLDHLYGAHPHPHKHPHAHLRKHLRDSSSASPCGVMVRCLGSIDSDSDACDVLVLGGKAGEGDGEGEGEGDGVPAAQPHDRSTRTALTFAVVG